ncbi:MAG: DUF4197 domain-containing protein [Bacteroidota bacterium]
MKKLIIVITVLMASIIVSCDVLMPMLEEANKAINTENGGVISEVLSNEEVINGLKKALAVGTDTAVSVTSTLNGYYGDNLLRILLPPEAKVVTENLSKIPFGQKLVDDAILSMNRSAEDAATAAKPIFINAITSMSIKDGLTILKGKNPRAQTSAGTFDSTAATGFLKSTTYSALYTAFKPKINNSLEKKLVGNLSTNQVYGNLTGAFNKIAPFIGKEKVNSDLSSYVTGKALDGLFLKVADEEKKIRKDPYKWSVDIIRKVFGSVFKK